MDFCTGPRLSVSRFQNRARSSHTLRVSRSIASHSSAAITSVSRTRLRVGSRSPCSTKSSRKRALFLLRRRSILFADHQPQPGPRLVDRTNLVVHEPRRQRDTSNGVLDNVGWDTRRLFRPCDPQPTVLSHLRTQRRDLFFQLVTLLHEHDKHVVLVAGHAFTERGTRWQGSQVKAFGGTDQCHLVSFFHAELLWQRRARVTSHEDGMNRATRSVSIARHAVEDRRGNNH